MAVQRHDGAAGGIKSHGHDLLGGHARFLYRLSDGLSRSNPPVIGVLGQRRTVEQKHTSNVREGAEGGIRWL